MAAPAQPRPAQRRDAARSRRSILDAAEALFARRGYDATSMQAIARRAKVSSALPAYFFGSKDGLYRATFERCFAAREERLEFVRLIGWAALHGAGKLRARPRHSAAVERAVRAVLDAGHRSDASPARDPDQLIISVVALCFFPFEHTMLSAMGIDASDPAFTAARRAHVVEALMRMIGTD
ncbi:MAG: TetR family transcriptional regulator [Actinobacteria bacterium]|nr:TetR family transcriptional regulator [Actinomycetota bacterium]